MALETEQNDRLNGTGGRDDLAPEGDVATRSLSEALRLSFAILKVIMVVLVVIFLASGFRTVGPDEEALVLRFGRIQRFGTERRATLGPGPHWVLPYPIDRVIKIPVGRKVNLAVNSFWYFLTEKEIISGKENPVRPGQPLRPTVDGYCLTRGPRQGPAAINAGESDANESDTNESGPNEDGSDYGIVHTRWALTYRISDAEAFFRNVYVQEPRPGQQYGDLAADSVEPMLTRVVEDAVVSTLVHYTIDQVKFEQVARVTSDVRRRVQKRLDEMDSGIVIESMQLTQSTWPRQVNAAFEAVIRARQASDKIISEARTYAEQTLNEAAGPVAEELLAAIKNTPPEPGTLEQLWSQVAGAAREKIAQARAYRTEVVEQAKANARYLQEVLPEYRKRPQLVLQRIYVDAMQKIMENADEKFVIQQAEAAAAREIRILLNRDPTLKPKEKTPQNQQ